MVGSLESDRRYSKMVKHQIAKSGLSARVELCGRLTDTDLIEALKSSQVLVLPSYYEGYGIAYLEGMAFGLPAIGTTQGAAGEIITHGQNGCLITPGSIVELREELQKLIFDRAALLRMSLAARERYLAQPTWEQSGRDIREFLIFTHSGEAINVEYSFTRYLRAKVSVDDRAMNQGVWDRMAALLPVQTSHRPLRILEVGCGIGTMVERMVRKGLLSHVEYTGIDLQPEIITHAAQYLKEWTKLAGFRLVEDSGEGFLLEDGHRELAVRFIDADLQAFLDRDKDLGDWDLLVAHAFLDLVDVSSSLAPLLGALRKGGVFYFTLNFDGQTILEPLVDLNLDEQIERFFTRPWTGV